MIINFIDGTGGGSGSGYTLPIATQSTLGGVKIGTGIAIDSAGTISADVAPDLSGLFAGVEYDSSATSINFYDREGTLVGQVDASSFVIDGMIEDVYITGSTMVIEFNTEAGKQDIEIDLTDIFNPANYYTKSQVDAEITAATNPIQSQVDDMERVTATALTELHDSIIDLSGVTEDMATQEWVDDAIEAALSGITSDVLQPVSDFPQDAPNGSVVAKPAAEPGRKVITLTAAGLALNEFYIFESTAREESVFLVLNRTVFPELLFYVTDQSNGSIGKVFSFVPFADFAAAHPGQASYYEPKYIQLTSTPQEFTGYYTDPSTIQRVLFAGYAWGDGTNAYLNVPEDFCFFAGWRDPDTEHIYHNEGPAIGPTSLYRNADGTWEDMLGDFVTSDEVERQILSKGYISGPATTTTLGGVKVGSGLFAANDGTLLVNGLEIISGYHLATKTDVDNAIAAETARTESTYLKEHQSLSNYYTKSEVDAELSGITEDIDTLDEVVSQSLVDLEERKVSSATAKTIVALTQAEYNALATKDPNTLYLING